MTDPRDGTMTSISGPLSPAQQRIYDWTIEAWQPVPIGVHEAILRALKDRGLVETQWDGGVRQWRRKVSAALKEKE